MSQVTREQKLRLGVFVALSLGALGTGMVFLVGQSFFSERDEYLIRFSRPEVSFSGLEIGSPVKYSGITIGQVRALRVSIEDVGVIEVSISVEKGTPIAEDSLASLASSGITGLKYIEISRGSATARIRNPGEEIPAGDSLMDELSVRASSIAQRLDLLLESLQDLIGPDAKHQVERLLEESSGILEDNRPQIAEIMSHVRLITIDLSRISRSGVMVAAKTDSFVEKMNEIGDSLHDLLSSEGSVVATIKETERLLGQLNMVVLRTQGDLDVTMRHLREASANIEDFSQEVRDDPRVLIGGGRGESRRDESR